MHLTAEKPCVKEGDRTDKIDGGLEVVKLDGLAACSFLVLAMYG